MKTEFKLAAVGNSRGVRLPAVVIRRYRFGERIVAELRDDGLLLRAGKGSAPKLSWQDTAKAMAAAAEDWSDWDSVDSDGLGTAPWERRRAR